MERAPKHVSWLSMHLRMPSGLWSDVQVLQNNVPPQQRLIFKWFDCTKGLQFHPTLQHPMLFLFFGHHLHYSEPLGAHFSFWYVPLHFSCSPSLFHMLWIVHRSGLARLGSAPSWKNLCSARKARKARGCSVQKCDSRCFKRVLYATKIK